jgi:hypothetical protein
MNPPAGGIFFLYSSAVSLVDIFNMNDRRQKKLTGAGDVISVF